MGCRAPTEVMLDIHTDADCRDGVGTAITVGNLNGLEARPPSARSENCTLASGRIGSLAVVPRDGKDDELASRVVTGFYKTPEECVESGYLGGCIVARRVLNFIPPETLALPIFMESSCIDVPCGAVETCRNGRCVSARLDDPETCTDPGGCETSASGGTGNSGAGGASTGHGGTSTSFGGALIASGGTSNGGTNAFGGTFATNGGSVSANGGAQVLEGGTTSSGGTTAVAGAPPSFGGAGGTSSFGGAGGTSSFGGTPSLGGALGSGGLGSGGTSGAGGTLSSGGAAGTPGMGGSAGSGGTSCDWSGSYALKLSLQATWNANLTIASGNGTFTFWLGLDAVQSGATLNSTLRECGRITPDFKALLLSETYNRGFPNSLFDGNSLPRVSASIALGGSSPGASFKLPSTAFLMGTSLSNPVSGAWPGTLSLTSVDMDGDQRPGVTGAYATGNGYSYPHTAADVLSLRADVPYVASRLVFSLDGSVTSCGASSGSARVTAIDDHILDCHLDLGLACALLQSQFLDTSRPVYAAVSASYALVKVTPNASCAVIRNAL